MASVDNMALEATSETLDPTAQTEVTTVTTDITEVVSIQHHETKKQTSSSVPQPFQALQDRERKAREERDKAAAEMQNWWDAAMIKNFNAHGYEKVAVLIIKWLDRLDDLKLGPEVGYHFNSTRLQALIIYRSRNSPICSKTSSTTTSRPFRSTMARANHSTN